MLAFATPTDHFIVASSVDRKLSAGVGVGPAVKIVHAIASLQTGCVLVAVVNREQERWCAASACHNEMLVTGVAHGVGR